ncbi:LysE family translocator [Bradyrhizobium sp. U87765 SZCCT0131]|uniref:LysE family translocator n=1 Tax=unclassified Bradyrhizobium TaxID=2631580 RepID=UPI001BAC91F0|nr:MULTISPECIES: LysE family translocator [unclassified Bradyrhizobium]MBR1217378.1 LysE family translocator [Bradyrhizobium sp. U87765 SZCCT0131]MBR1265025.1 LysE family translocator [Bradyrhizobium sp. U87765 SZCCT0134]MBR1305007.1 LysE family translocator [Bradyrhizobium sp. U87765 SZCCT0110]MBR1320793.1 LysE family translocator [Bradyrhizobium sp. U87765 SZCCT0109]MBR1349213.1 LysE family translocator [Bradyrhizobium sp. U87765 SZCCT0048]
MLGSWAAFALTSLVIEITPGPNMAYLAALSLSNGVRVGLTAVAGIALGLSVYGIAAALGLAALIDGTPLLYEALRWAGVIYLLWLAWDGWRSEAETSATATDDRIRPAVAFRRGLVTNLLNPKAAVFYIAILPDFVRINLGAVRMQTLVLSAIYVGVAAIVHLSIVLLAGALQHRIDTADKRRTVRRILALLLVGIAVWFAVSTQR